jgi:hypothetical protein
MARGAAQFYEASPIRRRPIRRRPRARRTKAEIATIEAAIYDVLEADHPQTVRGLFYQLVSRGVVPKTEAAYKATVGRLSVRMRRAGRLPYMWIADETRWMRKPRSYTGLEAALKRTAETYRRALWADLPIYVEVWCEKDARAGVIFEETEVYDVPLMVTRGFSSLAFLYSAAEDIKQIGKPAYLYQVGDYDPAGVAIPRQIEAELRGFAPKAEIHFERLAVTPAQIAEWHLPTRPTKRGDTRGRRFVGESVELDAIPAGVLRQLVRDAIRRHIPAGHLDAIEVAEESEREILLVVAQAVAREFKDDK